MEITQGEIDWRKQDHPYLVKLLAEYSTKNQLIKLMKTAVAAMVELFKKAELQEKQLIESVGWAHSISVLRIEQEKAKLEFEAQTAEVTKMAKEMLEKTMGIEFCPLCHQRVIDHTVLGESE